MKLLINIIFCFLFLLASQISHSESDALKLRSEMSIGEFKNMGLSKLSDSELVRLYQWIKTRGLAEPVDSRLSVFSDEQLTSHQSIGQPSKNSTITSSIKGSFEGWSGASVFRLSNGQVWRQRLKGRWRYISDSPSVVIKKNFMGYYVMRVDNRKSIGVKRIK